MLAFISRGFFSLSYGEAAPARNSFLAWRHGGVERTRLAFISMSIFSLSYGEAAPARNLLIHLLVKRGSPGRLYK